MTAPDLLGAILRRWYVMLVGALLSLLALYAATHHPPTYFTQYYVVLLPPRSATFPNNIEDPRFGLAQMAGVIVTDYNAGRRQPLVASDETTLYGEGVRSGSQVRTPNEGSQWQPLYTKPNIEVQVVGSSPELVRTQAQRIARRLTLLLQERQDKMGIKQDVRIAALVSPSDPVIAQVGGSRARVELSVAVIGCTLTTMLAVQLDRWLLRRRRRNKLSRSLRASEATLEAGTSSSLVEARTGTV